MKEIANILILLGGLFNAYAMTSKKRRMRLSASIVGVLCQPGWFYIAITSNNHGLTALSVWYTLCWCRGVYNNWKGGTQDEDQ